MGIYVLIKRGRDKLSHPVFFHRHSCTKKRPCKNVMRKIAVCKPGRGFSPDTLILYLPDCKTGGNKCFLFKAPSLWYFVTAVHIFSNHSVFLFVSRTHQPNCLLRAFRLVLLSWKVFFSLNSCVIPTLYSSNIIFSVEWSNFLLSYSNL